MGNEQQQGQGTPVTMEAIQKLVSDGIAAAVKPLSDAVGGLDHRIQSYEKNSGSQMTRRAYIDKNMKELPSIYTEQLPQTEDAGELARAEQKIREQYRKDYAGAVKAGVAPRIPDVSGNPPANGLSPSQAIPGGVDTSPKTSSVDLIQAGLEAKGRV